MWWSATALGTAIGTTVAVLLGLVTSDTGLEGAGLDEMSGGMPLLLGVAPVEPGSRPEADAGAVRLGDRVAAFARGVQDVEATAGGIYVLVGDELWVTDFDTTLETGLSGIEELHASPDGRYLGFLDADGSEARQVATVYDTRNGERVVHLRLPAGVPVQQGLDRIAAESGLAFLRDLG